MRLTADSGVELIVNADDLGISPAVNEAIFSHLARGRVTSATLLANGPAIEDAVRRLSQFPNCSFGAHLNVIEFEPLSAKAMPLLTRGGGMSRPLVEASASSPRFMQAVYEEFKAQVEKLIARGVPVSHLDSHQHVHTIPWLFPVVKAIQRRFGIRAIRASRNIYLSDEQISWRLKARKVLYNRALRTVYRSRTTDGMTDLKAVAAMQAEEATRFGSIEIMVHPGAEASDDATLASNWLDSLAFKGRLINYKQL